MHAMQYEMVEEALIETAIILGLSGKFTHTITQGMY